MHHANVANVSGIHRNWLSHDVRENEEWGWKSVRNRQQRGMISKEFSMNSMIIVSAGLVALASSSQLELTMWMLQVLVDTTASSESSVL
jgi:hypothetical protein